MRGIIPHCLGSQMKLVKSRSKLEPALRLRGQLERVGFWVIWSKVVLNKCMVFRPGAAGAPGDCLEMYILKSHSRPTGVAPSICVLISSLAHADVHSCLRITWRVCKTNKTKQNNKTIKQNNKTTPPPNQQMIPCHPPDSDSVGLEPVNSYFEKMLFGDTIDYLSSEPTL